jgi:4-hydroxy-2-oxoheptanedioate aldolase
MTMPQNRFKSRLLAGELQWGLWSSLASPVAAEALSLTGFDWMLFDTEHSPVEIATLQSILQAAATGTASAVARPAWNDKVLIKRLLDIGIQTLLVPFVETAAEAEAAVRATRYPPDGVRGVAGATRAEDALRHRDWGYRFVAAGVDTGLLVGSARALLQAVSARPL